MAAASPAQAADPRQDRLRCERYDVGPGVVRVSLRGDLDASSGPDLGRVLRAVHDDAAFVVVDLDEIASVDGAGAAALRAAGAQARRQGCRIVAVNAQPPVRSKLERAGVERDLKLIATPS